MKTILRNLIAHHTRAALWYVKHGFAKEARESARIAARCAAALDKV